MKTLEKKMRKHSKGWSQTLEFELPQLCPKVGLNTILISDLEVGIERRACPCTKIEIPLKSCRDHMLVPVPVSVVLVHKVHWYSNSLGVPVPLFLVPVLLLHYMWVPVPVSLVAVPLPPQLPLFTLELPGASRQRL